MTDFHPDERDDVVFMYHANPPDECDTCTSPIIDKFYDALLPRYGSWANVCQHCYNQQGCSLGTGFGQRYERQINGKYKKTAG